MARFLRRHWPALVLACAALACDDAASRTTTAPPSIDAPLADIFTDGHQFTLVNGEYVPVGTYPAKILSPATVISMSCDSDVCTGSIEVAHFGYWHGSQAMLDVDVWGSGRSLLKTSVPLTTTRCQAGWPCVWKELRASYPLPAVPKCGVAIQANTRHEAWWNVTGTVSVNGVSLSFGRFGSTQNFSNDQWNNGTCPEQTGTVAGGGYSGDCYFCQQWLTYDHGVLIREEWECTQIASSACAGLAT